MNSWFKKYKLIRNNANILLYNFRKKIKYHMYQVYVNKLLTVFFNKVINLLQNSIKIIGCPLHNYISIKWLLEYGICVC